MSAGLVTPEVSSAPPARRMGWARLAALAFGLLVVLAGVRAFTGEHDLTSSGTVEATLRLAVPIGLAGLGGLWAERSGIINIGLEGMMILGTWFGAWGGLMFGPWAGVVAGIIGGALGGVLHALATVTFGVDHIVSGVAINILGLGAARFLSSQVFVDMEGGDVTQSPSVDPIQTISIPGISDAANALAGQRWFLISDLAGIVGGVTTNLSLLTILAILTVPMTFYVLWRTAFGLRLRSCGENPQAAESLGVNVYRMKYIALMVSGGFAGLGGAFLSEVASSIYRENQTGGRGFIGLATMIFGNWRPGGLAMGASLFGYTDALQTRGGGDLVHGLLLLLALLIAVYAVWQFSGRHYVVGVVSLGIAALIATWFALVESVPGEIVRSMPYFTTLLVLALASQRLRAPANIGQVYRRGNGG